MRLYKTQYSFRISGNRGYDSNRKRFLCACLLKNLTLVINVRCFLACKDNEANSSIYTYSDHTCAWCDDTRMRLGLFTDEF